MTLVVLAGGAGLFGSGPLSHASVHAPGLDLEYERFARNGAPGLLRFELAAPGDGELRLWLGDALSERLRILSVVPEPADVAAGANGTVFTFHVAGANDRVALLFHTQPVRPGRIAGQAGVEGGASVRFEQIVYP